MTDAKSELKPCPFCGAAVVFHDPFYVKGGQTVGVGRHMFYCESCRFTGSWETRSQLKQKEYWNTRHKDALWLLAELEKRYRGVCDKYELGIGREYEATVYRIIEEARELCGK